MTQVVEAEIIEARGNNGRFLAGNPGGPGRPASRPARSEMIRAFLEGSAGGTENNRLTAMVMSMYALVLDAKAEAKDRVAAFNALCNQGYGKPTSNIEVSGEVKGKMEHAHLHGTVDTMAILRDQMAGALEEKKKRLKA